MTKLMICITGVFALLILYQNEAFRAVGKRIVELDFSSFDTLGASTTNRSDIWIEFIKKTFSSYQTAIFGSGLNSTSDSAHSFYIEMIYYYGIFGASLFLILIVTPINLFCLYLK